MNTAQQALCHFHNVVGDVITDLLCKGNVRREDITEYDVWSAKQIGNRVEEALAETAKIEAEDAADTRTNEERAADYKTAETERRKPTLRTK